MPHSLQLAYAADDHHRPTTATLLVEFQNGRLDSQLEKGTAAAVLAHVPARTATRVAGPAELAFRRHCHVFKAGTDREALGRKGWQTSQLVLV